MNASRDFTSSPAFFEAKYQQTGDPWSFSSKPSELRRYDAIVDALAHRRYSSAYEPGCSIGVLTERLASFCDAVYAVDFSPTAVAIAQQRCASLSHVTIACASFPEAKLVQNFDLLILSEIGYYFDPEQWQAVFASLAASMRQGDTVLAAHWLGNSPDHCISGDQVHAILQAHPGFLIEHSERYPSFRIDRLVKL